MQNHPRLSWLSLCALSIIPAALSNGAQAGTLGFSIAPSTASIEFPFLPHALTDGLTVDVRDDQTLAEITDAQIDTSTAGTITVTHAGYTAVTLIGVSEGQVTIFLKPLAPVNSGPVVSGTMGNYTVSDDSSMARAGLVYSALSADQLVDFQMSAIISPLKDTIDVYGSRQIPSNIVLPQQSVSIVLGSVSLNKPNYRLPVTSGISTVFAGMQGEIKASDLTSLATSGGSVSPSILNDVTFDAIGFTQPFTTTADMSLDVPATYQLTGSVQVSASAAPYQADILMAAVSDINGDRKVLVPTDIKDSSATQTTRDQSITLKTTASPIGVAQGVVAIAYANSGSQISGVIATVSGSQASTGEFLNNDAVSDFQTFPTTVSVTAPTQGVGIASFEAAANSDHGAGPVWLVYVLPSAAGALTVTTSDNPTSETLASYSIDQLDFGSSFSASSIDGETIMQNLARFSRSAAAQTKSSTPHPHH
jgi:hypothetical protein